MEDESLAGLPPVPPESQTPSGETTPDASGSGVEQPPLPGSEAQTNTEGESSGGENLIPIPKDKWRDTQRDAREYQRLQKEIQSQQAALTQPTFQPPAGTYQDPNLSDPSAAIAINAIAQAVKAELSPQLSYLEKVTETQAIQDIGVRPYAQDLAKEIAAEYISPDLKALPVTERMERAYALAVGKNINQIIGQSTTQARTDGQTAAYQKIAEKQAGQPATVGAAAPKEGGNYSEQLNALEGSERDTYYNKYRDQIWQEAGLGTPRS